MTIFQDKIREFNIKVVESHNPVQDPNQFIAHTRGLIGVEGFVICWDTGHRVKCKAEDYLRKHKSKESMSREKNVIELIVTEKLDDVKAFLDAKDLARVEVFERDFWEGMTTNAALLYNLAKSGRGKFAERKDYAVEFVQKQDEKLVPFLYRMFDEKVNALELLKKAVAGACGTQTKIDESRWMWGGIKWADAVIDE